MPCSEYVGWYLRTPALNDYHYVSICMENGEYIVEDFASTNGSFVNGIQISRCILKDGDVIEVGEAKFHFYEEKVRQK